MTKKRKGFSDQEVLTLARRIVGLCGTHTLIKSFEEAVSGNEELECMASRLKVSRTLDGVSTEGLGNRNLAELLRLVGAGMENGSDASRPLASFASHLEREMKMRNRFRAKVGGLQALTYMGMSVFFPLFSGISAIILSDSLGLFDKSSVLLGNSFMVLAISYVPIILYLSSAFSHPERSALQNAFAALPYFALVSIVMLATHAYLANML